MTIQAIETRYAGCRFRSRLEARWAVFFDTLDIPWEYEPQGFNVTWRLRNDEDTFPYLPDFWLPDEGVWVEVKGSLDAASLDRLLNAAASLSSNDGGGCHDAGGHDVIVCGPIPAENAGTTPIRLHMHKGDLIASPWPGGDPHYAVHHVYELMANDAGDVHPQAGPFLLEGMDYSVIPLWRDAFTTARRARFEHGEVGA